MSIHNISFPGEIMKILCGYPLLPGAMLLFVHIEFCKVQINLVVPDKMPFFFSTKD